MSYFDDITTLAAKSLTADDLPLNSLIFVQYLIVMTIPKITQNLSGETEVEGRRERERKVEAER